MLIKTAAVRPWAEGMDPDCKVLVPGERPPLVSPHCHKCNVPVEGFTLDYISSHYYLGIQVRCHGKTSGARIPHDEVLYKSRHGGVIWFFTETRVSNGRR